MSGFWRGCPVDTMNRMRFMPTWSRCGHNDSQDAGRHGTFAAMSPPGPAPTIELRGVYKRFLTPTGEAYTALRDLNLEVQPGEFCSVVGPTGCGKSTTLALISGLEPPSAGEVQVFGKPVTGIDKDIGYVFQTDAVFPWKNVLDNVAAGPRFRGQNKRAAHEQARDWIARVGLTGFESHYPHQLSGGMRKRVALAQTLMNIMRATVTERTREIGIRRALGATRTHIIMQFLVETISLSVVGGLTGILGGLLCPATIKGAYQVDLPRPRNVAEIRFQPRFNEIYQVIWEDLRQEVLVSYERAKRSIAA